MIGLLYDVHGNLPALDAVLADAGEVGAERFLIGGDVALFGPWPAETVARLSELPATWIRGNTDRWLVDRSDAPDLVGPVADDCVAALGDETTRRLAALPFEHVTDDVRFVHASPISDLRSFAPEPADDDAELLDDAGEPLVVSGHTHLPFQRRSAGGPELVNPGSVGMPLDGDHRAAWAVLHDDGRVEQRRVAYEHERTTAAVRERYGEQPWVVRFAEARLER